MHAVRLFLGCIKQMDGINVLVVRCFVSSTRFGNGKLSQHFWLEFGGVA